MPRPTLRTRSRKRKYRSLPVGRKKVLHKKRKTANPKCFSCGRDLTFILRSTLEIRKLPKTRRGISCIYGGQLCHLCLRNSLKQTSRIL
ncbi:MAG: 50S ribosomal protein L34e [Candidatus Bathyarchaeia archaeon]